MSRICQIKPFHVFSARSTNQHLLVITYIAIGVNTVRIHYRGHPPESSDNLNFARYNFSGLKYSRPTAKFYQS